MANPDYTHLAEELARTAVELVSQGTERGREEQARRSIAYGKARADRRPSDGRHFVSVPYRDDDPSIFAPEGMYVALFESAEDPASAVFYGDIALLSSAEYSRYLSGELPGGLDAKAHRG